MRSLPATLSVVRRPRRAEGSLLLSMLAALIVLGLVTALFVTVIVGQRTVQFDTNFNTSVHAADTGMQRAVDVVRNDVASLTDSPVGATQSGSGTVTGAEYSWEMTKVGEDHWEVEATGTSADISRVLAASITRDQLFNVGAFSAGTMNIGNNAEVISYNSTTGEVDTGVGAIGSNEGVNLSGNPSIDQIYLYGGAECDGNNCDDAELFGSSEDKTMDDAFIATEMQENCGATSGFPPLVVAAGDDIPEGVNCYSSVSINGDDVRIENGGEAVLLVGSGTVSINGSHTRVNCPENRCDEGPINGGPTPLDLQIFTLEGDVTIANQQEIAWLVYAPNSACSGNFAQSTVYGALICNHIGSNNGPQGGFTSYLDETILDASFAHAPGFMVSSWREEVGS